MKKILSYLLFAAITAGAFSTAANAAGDGAVAVVSRGTDTKIITPAGCSDVQSYAAETLRRYIEEITGLRLEISGSPENSDGNRIFVGERVGTGVSAENLPDGSYVLKEKDGDLYIVGSGKRGNIYGVYGFLEKYCGCRRYTKDLKIIPKAESINVPKNLDYTYKPYFEYTETEWSSPRDPEYSMANGINGGVYRSIPPEGGGTVDYISLFCHTLAYQFCSPDKYFKEHPEYFATHYGVRSPNQLCLTNPGTLDVVTKEVLDLIKAKRDPSQPIQIVSLTQSDNGNYCTCKNCMAVDAANGSHAGTMINFANAVARRVKEAGYDNIAIDTFAYTYTRKAPGLVRPDDNVIVRLCSIECCFAHPLNDPKCVENVEFMNDLREWSKICDRLYIWDYANNYKETLNIFPNLRVLQPNMQTFYESGAKGMYVEGNYYIEGCDAEFGELKAYLISKLMQDPYTDCDAETNGFLEAYYGAGWKNIREYLDFISEKAVGYANHLGIFQSSKSTLPGMREDEIKRCDGLWAEAKRLAQNDDCLKRVKRSELSWRYWKCSNMRGEFSRLLPCRAWMSAQEKLHDDFVDFGTVKYSENSSKAGSFTDCATTYLLTPADNWNKRFEGKLSAWIEPLVLNVYKFLKTFGK